MLTGTLRIIDPTSKSTLHAVVLREDDQWVAQCLEYDISAQAPTLDELYERFCLTLHLDMEESEKIHGEPFAGIEPWLPLSIILLN